MGCRYSWCRRIDQSINHSDYSTGARAPNIAYGQTVLPLNYQRLTRVQLPLFPQILLTHHYETYNTCTLPYFHMTSFEFETLGLLCNLDGEKLILYETMTQTHTFATWFGIIGHDVSAHLVSPNLCLPPPWFSNVSLSMTVPPCNVVSPSKEFSDLTLPPLNLQYVQCLWMVMW